MQAMKKPTNTQTVLFEKTGPVARITLHRPDKYNSLNAELTQ